MLNIGFSMVNSRVAPKHGMFNYKFMCQVTPGLLRQRSPILEGESGMRCICILVCASGESCDNDATSMGHWLITGAEKGMRLFTETKTVPWPLLCSHLITGCLRFLRRQDLRGTDCMTYCDLDPVLHGWVLTSRGSCQKRVRK